MDTWKIFFLGERPLEVDSDIPHKPPIINLNN